MCAWPRQVWSEAAYSFIEKASMQHEERAIHLLRRQWLVDLLKTVRLDQRCLGSCAFSVLDEPPRVLTFGSALVGTAFRQGDIDFTLGFRVVPIHPPATPPPPATTANITSVLSGFAVFAHDFHSTVLSNVYDHVVAASPETQLQRIYRARIPILQFHPLLQGAPVKETPLRSAAFDVSVSLDGCRNSLLLRRYTMKYPVVRTLSMLLKQWGRCRHILNARRGWLSPYALTILVIHFLHSKGLIELFDQSVVDNELSEVCDDSHIATMLEAFSMGPHEPCLLDVAPLMQAFFQFYSEEFDFDEDVVDIRVGDSKIQRLSQWMKKLEVLPSDKDRWNRVGYGIILIRDPFEEHSLGRSIDFFRAESLREEFRTLALQQVVTPEKVLGALP